MTGCSIVTCHLGEKDAQLGDVLGSIVVSSLKTFTAINNDLMASKNYNNQGDITSYLKNGVFVDFGGVYKNGVINVINALLIGNAVNEL